MTQQLNAATRLVATDELMHRGVQSPMEKLNRFYSEQRSVWGSDKSTILRKMKAQFPSGKFAYKGSSLFVKFGDNPEQKVTG